MGSREIESWIGLDVGKAGHHATVLDAEGEVILDRSVRNDEAALERLLEDAGPGAALVIDQPGSIGTLAVALARRRAMEVAYVPGLVMRRASRLYPGEAKTDRRDSFVIADTARIHQARVHWLAEHEELLEQQRILGGHDEDLAHDYTRAANRLRDLLLQASPPVERVLGDRVGHPAVRALLARYPIPSAMRAAGKRRLLRLVEPKAPRMGVRLVEELFTALAAQTITVAAEATLGRVIADLARELTRLRVAREQLAQEIAAVFELHPQAPVLLTWRGVQFARSNRRSRLRRPLACGRERRLHPQVCGAPDRNAISRREAPGAREAADSSSARAAESTAWRRCAPLHRRERGLPLRAQGWTDTRARS